MTEHPSTIDPEYAAEAPAAAAAGARVEAVLHDAEGEARGHEAVSRTPAYISEGLWSEIKKHPIKSSVVIGAGGLIGLAALGGGIIGSLLGVTGYVAYDVMKGLANPGGGGGHKSAAKPKSASSGHVSGHH